MGTGLFDTGGGGGGFGAGGAETGGAGRRVGAPAGPGAVVRAGVEDAGTEGGDDTGTGASVAIWAGVTDGAAVAWLAFPVALVLPQPATAPAASRMANKAERICPVLPSSGH